MSMTSEDAVAHPEAILGPRLGTAYFLGLETGIILNLFYRFWKDSSNTSKWIRLVVLFETVFAVVQTALAYYAVYFFLVSHFGDWNAAMKMRWTGKLLNILNLLLAGIAKAVFICRCWTVSARKLYTLLILAVLFFTNEVLGLYFVIRSFRTQTSIEPSDFDTQTTITYARHIAHQPLYTTQLVLAAALNVIIVFILLSTTPRTRFRIQLRYPITSLYRVILLFWEVLVFPAIFTFIALILYLALISESFWSDLFQNTVGQIYVFSLFAYFASAQARRGRTNASDNMSGGEDVSWRRGSNFGSGEDGFDGFEVAGRSRGSDYELEPFEQAPASVQFDEDFASRGPLSLSIPERARVRPYHPEGDGPLTPI